jgi:uncharacterized protein YigA (DUF484 family)
MVRERAAALFAEDAEAVRVVHQQPGVVSLGQRQQARQRRQRRPWKTRHP